MPCHLRLAICFAAASVAACAPKLQTDPLVSLASGEPSAAFDAAYWTALAREGRETWSRALSLCAAAEHQPLPNCRTVREVHFILTLEREAERASRPYDGGGGIPWPQAVAEQLDTAAAADGAAPSDSAGPDGTP